MWMPFLNRQAQGLVRKSRLSYRRPTSSKIPAERKAEGGCRRDTQTRSGSSRGSESSARAREARGLSGQSWGQRGLGAGGQPARGLTGRPLVWPHLPAPNRSRTFAFIHEMALLLGFGKEAPSADLQPELQMESPARQWRRGLQGDLWASSARALMSCPGASVREAAPPNTCAGDEDARGDAARHATASF